MSFEALQARASALDAVDPLASLRARFALPHGVYLCGHSLGAAPRAARDRVLEELDDWETLGVAGHHASRRPWIGYADLLKSPLARLVGASEREVVAMNGLTVNLHLMMATFYAPTATRHCILIEKDAFSSDRHAVEAQLRTHGYGPDGLIELAPPAGADLIDEAQIEQLLAARGADIALVLWPGVQYRTGQAFDLARIARAAHAAGARCGFDLAHAVGNVPLALHASGADFAAWCGYKYLNGGPGALAGAFIHERAFQARPGRLAGWWGHEAASRFDMEPGFLPSDGADGWQLSNPPILSTAPLLAALELFDQVGLEALRRKSLALGDLLIEGLDAHFAADLQLVTPRTAARRGCQLSMRVVAGRAAGRRVFAALEADDVIADWREPDIIRVAPVPFYNRYADVVALLQALRRALP